MAYDPVKAHEYYEKYRKKGLKKGRKKGASKKKGSKKSVKKTSLVGQSTAGLNDSGRIEAAMIKEKMTADMNAALSKATTQEEKDAIRRDYSQKASQQIQGLKNNPQYAKAKAAKASKGKSGSGSKGSDASKEADKKKAKKRKAAVKKLKKQINELKSQITSLPPEQKQQFQTTIQTMLQRLKALKG